MTTSTPRRLQSGKASSTAGLTAMMRAVDARLAVDQRLADDRYAHLYAAFNPRFKHYVRSAATAKLSLKLFDRLFGGFLAEILLRSRHFDRVLADARNDGIDQVLLLGAGYDSTPMRHPDLRFVEIDHPATQRAKRAVLAKSGITTDNVTYLPVDLETERLAAVLTPEVFDRGRRTLVGWHGVTFFLEGDAFQHALADIAAICAPGSRLVFDYMDRSVIDGTNEYRSVRTAARLVARRGEPYRLGMDQQSATRAAEAAGFRCLEHLRVTDLIDRFGGARPYCSRKDFMGVLTVERA
ncbi:SAM-dependent methyltransferase [Actinoplanes sp. NPDC049118]|uniref:class I SAM-dependent methyltransferase n=1 Tax=Actinoplanes sp. NPDC049118 TaxID=3155769 RepID=UPI0033C89DC3